MPRHIKRQRAHSRGASEKLRLKSVAVATSLASKPDEHGTPDQLSKECEAVVAPGTDARRNNSGVTMLVHLNCIF